MSLAGTLLGDGDQTSIVPYDGAGALDFLQSITVDCLQNEAPVDASEVTEFPVEQGADITDHVQTKSTELTLNVVHSNIDTTGLVAFVPDALPPTRAQDFYLKLLDWKNKAQLLAVLTPRRAYANMLITNVTPNWDATNGGAFFGSISFRAVVMASTDLVDVANVSGAPGSLKKRGPQKAEEATPTESESFVHALSSAVGGG